MNVKEKLVELLVEFIEVDVWDNGEFIEKDIDFQKIASNIIAHGVTVQDNTEISDELLKQLRNAPLTVLHEEPTIELVQEWISVKDRLPDVGSIVLVSDNETDCHVWQYTDSSERGVAMPWRDEFGIPCKTEEITHWMPLPQPPEGE